MNCKNCGYRIDGKFCSHCGQNAKVDRINFSNFLNEVTESVFQINKGFFYTLRELFVRPGSSLKEFLNGQRKNHFKPIAYVLTLSTLYFLIAQITNQNTWMDDLISGWINGATGHPQVVQAPIILIWFSKNYAYLSLLLLPIFSLASYLSFIKSDTNYLEHIVINSYITGQQAVFYSMFAIVKMVIESDVIEVFSLFVAISYTYWVFWQFFSKGNRMINILCTIMTYILYLLFSIGLLFALMGINEF
ncbi:MAG: DUF3667 domain-containing protein [Saprospiraceae bacterium]